MILQQSKNRGEKRSSILTKTAILFPFVISTLIAGFAFFQTNQTAYSQETTAKQAVSNALDTCFHLALISDLHLPSKKSPPPESIMQAKSNVIATINSWTDVCAVVVLGDITALTGTKTEYAFAKNFLQHLKHPIWAINGNHDAVYFPDDTGRRVRANNDTVQAQNEQFKRNFGLENIYYTRRLGGFFLVFLGCDDPSNLARISNKQLEWLKNELNTNKHNPTLIFFHSPLQGTLPSNQKADFIAQPAQTIKTILKNNPQVFMWVSGHTHTTPANPDFASTNNFFEARLLNVHCPDIDREKIWTNSLFLYPDKVKIRTFLHSTGEWLPEYDRTIPAPSLGDGAGMLQPANQGFGFNIGFALDIATNSFARF